MKAAERKGWLPRGRVKSEGKVCGQREQLVQRLRGEIEQESLGKWQQDLLSES